MSDDKYNVDQSAKEWITEHMEEFGAAIGRGEDPTIKHCIHGVEFEVRLNKIPGMYDREE